MIDGFKSKPTTPRVVLSREGDLLYHFATHVPNNWNMCPIDEEVLVLRSLKLFEGLGTCRD
jgi:hypothetical protein